MNLDQLNKHVIEEAEHGCYLINAVRALAGGRRCLEITVNTK